MKNPYADHPTLAQAWEEGREAGFEQRIGDGAEMRLQLGPKPNADLLWVGRVPADSVISSKTTDQLAVRYRTPETWRNWHIEKYLYDGLGDAYDGTAYTLTYPKTLEVLRAASQQYRNVMLVHRVQVETVRSIASIQDGVIHTHYNEHEDYPSRLGLAVSNEESE